jgi:hypothetical protein
VPLPGGINEIVSFSFNILFIMFIINYIFHHNGHSRSHALVCSFVGLLLKFTDSECEASSVIFRLC